ncbi:MAG: plastocyanin/azurin family copper-binding protein [Candidatus Hydrothermarchaeales archaeon]
MDKLQKDEDWEFDKRVLALLILLWIVLMIFFTNFYQAREDTASVIVTHNEIKPKEIIIKRGTTVIWQNAADMEHTIESGTLEGHMGVPDNKFTSSPLKQGETFKYTFYESGVYFYYIAEHPPKTQLAKIVVE